MRRPWLVLVTAAVLAACDGGSSPELSLNDASGESKAVIPTDDGTIVGASGAQTPIKLPQGFSVYPGAQVLSNTSVDHRGKSDAHVVMATPDSPEKIAAFYADQARAAGVEPSYKLDTKDSAMLAGSGPGGLNFSITASVAPSEEERKKLIQRPITDEDNPTQRERKFAPRGLAKVSTPSAEPGATTAQLTLRYSR